MTMVAAIIACDGITIISDGRVTNINGQFSTSEEVDKMYPLPGACVCSFAGGVTNHLDEFMIDLYAFINYTQFTSIDKVSDVVRHIANDRAENDLTNASDWLRDYTDNTGATMMIAGYNGTDPAIRLLLPGEQWKRSGYPPQPYCAIGTGMKAANEILGKYFKESYCLKDTNLLGMKALINAESKQPNSVGGKTTIWNILPDQTIKKLEEKAVMRLRRKAEK